MQIFKLLSLAALGLPLAYGQSWYSASTSFLFQETCTTDYASAGVTPIPTSYDRSSFTIYSSEPVVTYETEVYVTANTTTTYPVTYWNWVTVYPTVTLSATTTTIYNPTPTTIGTVTSPTVVCTNGVTPVTTATAYTGEYTPVPGQNTTLPASFPTLVSCTEYITTSIHVWPTVQGTGTTTSTITPSAPGATTTTTTTYSLTRTVWETTVRVTLGDFVLAAATETVSTACEATPTVTYDARCAPTNLIAQMEVAEGLEIQKLSTNFTFGGWGDMAAGDPSLCCQLCVDNEGCVASVYWAQSSSCLLGYIGGRDDCGVAFTYDSTPFWEPRQGNIFQTGTGCGSIEYLQS